MLTNDERRRVASVLLLLNAVSKRFSKKDSWDELRMAVGTYEDAPFAGCVTFARLAELIDPDVTRNVPVSQITGLLDADLGKMVDREALLGLADECDEMRGDGLPIGSQKVYRIARRIREACVEGC